MNLVLSIEDTNKLRLKVGLKPIPIPENGAKNMKKNLSQINESKILEFSIEETNKFRKKLGLKLIVDESKLDDESRNYFQLKENERRVEKISNLKAKLQNNINEVRAKQRAEKGGILARIDGKGDVMDIDSWLDKVGKDLRKGGIKKLSFKTKDTEKKKEREQEQPEQEQPEQEQPEQEQPEQEQPEQEQRTSGIISNQREILTAKDVNVLDDSVSDDEFENSQLERDQNIKKSLNIIRGNNKLINPDDLLNNNNELSLSKKRKVELLDIESEIELANDDDEDKKISKLFKRDVSKFKRVKKSTTSENRKKIFDIELVDKHFTPIVLDDDDESNDIDDLDNILNSARQSTLKKLKFEYDDNENQNAEAQQSESFNENLEFLDKIKVEDTKPSLHKEIADEKTNEVSESVESIVSTRYKAILEAENEKNYNTYGVSNILTTLKATSNNKDKDTNSGAVKIVYTDDNGKVLNTKEAFKYLSHKFHGSKKS